MPIYEYRCDQCGLEKEYLQKISDAPISVCPGCGSSMTKLISAAGFQLKGSGWYVTDFRNSGAKPAAKEAAKGDAASAPADGKAESGGKSESGDKSETAAPAAADKSADKAADKAASTERKDGPAPAPASPAPAGN